MNNTPFTYHICWTKQNLHYYGVKYAEGCKPSDLWTTYFTSSGPVEELRKTLGEPDLREIRKTFKSVDKAIAWEATVLRRMKVTKRDDWVNECSWPARDNRDRKHSEETKKKMSEAKLGEKHPYYGKKGKDCHNFGRKASLETRNKMSEGRKGENNNNFGKHCSDETRKKISESLMGHKASDETRKKMSESHKGKKASDKTRKKISEATKGEKNHNFGKFGEDNPFYGRKHSQETLGKISNALKGRVPWNKGVSHSKETKKKKDKEN